MVMDREPPLALPSSSSLRAAGAAIAHEGLSREAYTALLFEKNIETVNLLTKEPRQEHLYSNYYAEKAAMLSKQEALTRFRESDEAVAQRLQDAAAKAKFISRMDVESDDEDGGVAALLRKRTIALDAQEAAHASKILAGPSNGSIVIDKFNIDMTREKFVCLRPGAWLNDEAINFYMCMLQERDDALCKANPKRRGSHYFNSFFMTKLREANKYSYGQVKRWSKKFDSFAKDKIFVPINIQNTHWTMAVLYMQKKEIHYYDSMSGAGGQFLRDLRQWVQDEALDKKAKVLDVTDWALISQEDDVPQQRNGFDCGVFSIMCADYASDDLPLTYTQAEMPANRVKIAAAIIRGSLNY